jgi:acyl-CoA dehydrogenase
VFAKYGSPEQQEKWLVPLLEGKIRSSFAMTERFGACRRLMTVRTPLST